jgi:ATP/maltotriose-dependent transcriptional regulator MalT
MPESTATNAVSYTTPVGTILGIAEGTAKIHLNSIYSKLNVASRASLLAAVGEYLDLLILKS